MVNNKYNKSIEDTLEWKLKNRTFGDTNKTLVEHVEGKVFLDFEGLVRFFGGREYTEEEYRASK